MGKTLLKTLDREFLRGRVQEFIDMIQRNMKDEYWSENNFLTDLPGKWNYSLVVTDENDIIQGFAIASEKTQSIHIHKFVVDAPFQQAGLGQSMLNRILEQAAKPITLKVRTDNSQAISFYKKNGFVIDGTEGNLHTMIRFK